jgi:hypothetical protein
VSFVVLILLGVLAWAVFTFVLTVVLFGPPRRWRRSDPVEEVRALRTQSRTREGRDEIRVSRMDRRRGDRRIGMPDPRELQIERRGGGDRRRRPAAV